MCGDRLRHQLTAIKSVNENALNDMKVNVSRDKKWTLSQRIKGKPFSGV